LKSVALLLLLLAFRAVIKRRERCDDSGNAVKRSNLWACAAPAAAAMHHEGMFLSLSPSSFLYRSSSSPLHPRPFEIHVHTG
jgi:hypothetical protein